MGQAADFFVNRTSGDRVWAAIPGQPEAEGHEMVVQARDFTAGHDRPYEIQQTTAIAAGVVLVPSTACLRSASGLAEWRVFDTQGPSGLLPHNVWIALQHPIPSEAGDRCEHP